MATAKFVPPAKDLTDRMISVLFKVGRPNNGTVDLLERRRNRVEGRARRIVPVRSGDLRDSHRSIEPRQQGRNIIAEVINFSDHAIFVHEGTNPTEGPNMWRGSGSWAGYLYGAPDGVSGQKSNPWLVEAYNQVAASDTSTTKFGRLPTGRGSRGGRNDSKKWRRRIT